jgi:hypothetical protein
VDDLEKLRKLAVKNETSATALMREALARFVENPNDDRVYRKGVQAAIKELEKMPTLRIKCPEGGTIGQTIAQRIRRVLLA